MKRFFLVDFENVGKGGFEKSNGLTTNDEVHVFQTEKTNIIGVGGMGDITGSYGEAVLKTHNVRIRKQSVDMHIASYLGYLIGIHGMADCEYTIISNDRDYDNIIDFWKEAGAFVQKKQKISVPKKRTSGKNTKDSSSSPAKTKTEPKQKPEAKEKPQARLVPKKSQLNQDIQKVLSKKGYEQKDIAQIAKIVVSHYGKESYPGGIHDDLGKVFTNFKEIYNDITPTIKKFK